MSKRLAYGRTHSANGWRNCNNDELERRLVPGTSNVRIEIQQGIPSIILTAWAAWWHRNVRRIDTYRPRDYWGWSQTNDVGSSNHLSGTAIDLNATTLAFRRYNMDDDERAMVHHGLELFEGTVAWGGDWTNPIDEMHSELGMPEGDSRLAVFADKLLRGHLGIYAAEPAPAQPNSMEYADVSQWQGKPVDESYPHRFVMFRVNNGEVVDKLAAENLAAARRLVAAGKLDAFGVYTFFRPGRDNLGTLKRVVGEPDSRMIVMLDIEDAKGSEQGTVTGDQTAGAQAFFDGVADWLGDLSRVRMGYWNKAANPGLLSTLPSGVRWVIPDYSAPKGHPRTTYPGWIAHQYTKTGRCAPWTGDVDLNYYGGTVTEFLREFGIHIESDSAPQTPAGERTPFPLPGGTYYGPFDGPDESISGRYVSDREEWRVGLRKYQTALGIPASGMFDDSTEEITKVIQRNRNWPISGHVYQGEWDAVLNGDHPPLPQYADGDPVPRASGEFPHSDPEQWPLLPEDSGGEVRRVGAVTGPGTSAVQFGVGGTDLGAAVRLPNGDTACFFGDTFESFAVGGNDWRSPIMLTSLDDSPGMYGDGIEFSGAAGGDRARQLWPYIHDSEPWTNGGFSTVLPTDALVVGGRVYLHVMVTRGLGDELWSEIQYSDDNGQTWTHGGDFAAWHATEFDGMRTHLTWDAPGDGYVYAITTGGLRRNKNALLWRVREGDVLDRRKWEAWGWNGTDWGWGRTPSPIFPDAFVFGEMNLRFVQGYWVLAFFDAAGARVAMRTVRNITDNWHTARDLTIVRNVAWEAEFLGRNGTLAQPYGGYILPGSTLDEMHLLVSQWNTRGGWPYHVVQFRCKAPR